MTLDQLIEELSKRDPATVVRNGFGSGRVDRGKYSSPAFTPMEETTMGEMLSHALDMKDSTQIGYNGRKYIMAGYVDALIGEGGECGDVIGRHHFLYWDTFAPNAKDHRADAQGESK